MVQFSERVWTSHQNLRSFMIDVLKETRPDFSEKERDEMVDLTLRAIPDSETERKSFLKGFFNVSSDESLLRKCDV